MSDLVAMAGGRCSLLCVLTLFLVCSFGNGDTNRRLKTTIFCPVEHKCSVPVNESYTNVAYTIADGTEDRLHYVYSSFGAPTVFVAKTSIKSNLTIEWDRFLSPNVTDRIKSVTFSHDQPTAVLALVFTKLIEFNDSKDSGDLRQANGNKSYELSEATWHNSSSESDVKNNIVQFRMSLKGNGTSSDNSSGSVIFKFRAFESDGLNSELPHLHYNANITQVYITLDNIPTSYPNSRFAIEMVTVTNSSTSGEVPMDISDTKSLDDETTPGAFYTINWARSSSDNMFLQWKPLCYTEREKSINNARSAEYYFPDQTEIDSDANFAVSYFGDLRNTSTNGTRISFGETDDKFYVATKYTTWALTIGYGTPPVETISLLVILIIIIGLGIPVLLIIVGGIYVIIKRHYQRGTVGYEDLTSSYPPIGT